MVGRRVVINVGPTLVAIFVSVLVMRRSGRGEVAEIASRGVVDFGSGVVHAL